VFRNGETFLWSKQHQRGDASANQRGVCQFCLRRTDLLSRANLGTVLMFAHMAREQRSEIINFISACRSDATKYKVHH
jgi:predicted DCC family thiol-disulfide oxidoreductase YuxK